MLCVKFESFLINIFRVNALTGQTDRRTDGQTDACATTIAHQPKWLRANKQRYQLKISQADAASGKLVFCDFQGQFINKGGGA